MITRILDKLFRASKGRGSSLERWYVLDTKWFGIKIHHILETDPEFHNHPWHGFSLIFGSYGELYEDGRLPRLRWLFNRISPWEKHKVIIFDKPVWTILFTGRRVNEHWQYGSSTKPWRGPNS